MLQQARRNGLDVGERLESKSQLLPGLGFYLEAFYDLDTERDLSNGLSPIPWSSMRLYGQDCGLDDAEFDEFVYLIRALDNAHMKHVASKMNNQAKMSGRRK